jgi:phosphatidylglycerophosphatase A
VTATAFVLFSLLGWGSTGLAALSVVLGVSAGVSALGIWSAGAAESHFGREDDRRIVIDEVAGQLVTLAPLASGAGDLARGSGLLWVVTGFVVFRVLDVWKPGPVGWAERRFRGGFGVMADDLVAGVLGALLLAALRSALGAGGAS